MSHLFIIQSFVLCFSPTTTIHTRNRACGGDSDSSRGGRRSVLLKFIASSCRRSRAMAQWRGRGQRRRGGDDDNNDDNNDDPALTIVHVCTPCLADLLSSSEDDQDYFTGRRVTGSSLQPPLLHSHIIVGYIWKLYRCATPLPKLSHISSQYVVVPATTFFFF